MLTTVFPCSCTSCSYWKFKQLIGFNLFFFSFFCVCVSKAELQIAEAVALVDTLQNWTILDKIIIPTKNPDKKFIFGKGNFEALTGKNWDFSALHLCQRKPSIAELFEDRYKHWGRVEEFCNPSNSFANKSKWCF